ncbi:protein CHUP1, chloroplastic isoform X1 [Phalaenopsis equestris]|uniref:protein CHUP1, chloroplastic isoform X1 n=1 Tax=Phalaenopsis equestris TaxID=78828 RepID=UPI0009E50571|nr:protein CHUP1, chloroplastic isoform X1 [Phalaenopsis equestris]XP_020589045.1 protein CHUP1, chloroplastic isoform X1 [Phalaenopsis equestris]XP_020589046.1 protein CHUP1, chloroplastic isoform X1 [Phalaenopsis equestris]
MKELSESKTSSSSTSSPSNRVKVSKFRENLKLESANRNSTQPTGKPKPISSESLANSKLKRSIFPNKTRLDGEIIAYRRETEVEDSKNGSRLGVRPVEKYARLRIKSDINSRRCEDEPDAMVKDWQKRLAESEILMKDMNLEISCLKEEIEKLKSLNVELEEQKNKLLNDLSAAEIKIAAFNRFDQVQAASEVKEGAPSELNNLQNNFVNKLDQTNTREKAADKKNIDSQIQSFAMNPEAKLAEVKSNSSLTTPLQSPAALKAPPPPPPRPPPPPPLRLLPRNEGNIQNATALVEFYHCLTKRDVKANGNGSVQASSPVHNSIVGELQNRSAHLLAIKADVETKGEFIKNLINKVQSAAYTNMDDVLTFVDWLDGELSKLADERAVLKHFNWPERKADALREAAVEYRDIKQLYAEVSSITDDASQTCDIILRKIANLVERSERNVQRLINLRGIVMAAYQDCKIPTDWMLDSGMINLIKLACVRLAKIYIKRVLSELELNWQIERRSAQESLLSQGVRFAYRVYQFVGGLDPETMRVFEELRSRVQWRESRDMMQNQIFGN